MIQEETGLPRGTAQAIMRQLYDEQVRPPGVRKVFVPRASVLALLGAS